MLRRGGGLTLGVPALALLFGVTACCAEGPPILSIWLSPTRDWAEASSDNCEWETIQWTGVTVAETGTSVIVVYQESDRDRIRTAVELYREGLRIPLEESTSMDHECDMGCPSPRTLYRLDVPAGEYTLVHRERTGTGKPVHTPGVENPWTEFEGERALVTTLVLTEPDAR